jgi:hypothetical protein
MQGLEAETMAAKSSQRTEHVSEVASLRSRAAVVFTILFLPVWLLRDGDAQPSETLTLSEVRPMVTSSVPVIQARGAMAAAKNSIHEAVPILKRALRKILSKHSKLQLPGFLTRASSREDQVGLAVAAILDSLVLLGADVDGVPVADLSQLFDGALLALCTQSDSIPEAALLEFISRERTDDGFDLGGWAGACNLLLRARSRRLLDYLWSTLVIRINIRLVDVNAAKREDSLPVGGVVHRDGWFGVPSEFPATGYYVLSDGPCLAFSAHRSGWSSRSIRGPYRIRIRRVVMPSGGTAHTATWDHLPPRDWLRLIYLSWLVPFTEDNFGLRATYPMWIEDSSEDHVRAAVRRAVGDVSARVRRLSDRVERHTRKRSDDADRRSMPLVRVRIADERKKKVTAISSLGDNLPGVEWVFGEPPLRGDDGITTAKHWEEHVAWIYRFPERMPFKRRRRL